MSIQFRYLNVGKVYRARDACETKGNNKAYIGLTNFLETTKAKGEEMSAETNSPERERRERKVKYVGASSAPVYGLGFIGALVYYLQHATTFVTGLLGFLKAMVWPAMLVYKLLEYLKM
jgi:hypothetical protein